LEILEDILQTMCEKRGDDYMVLNATWWYTVSAKKKRKKDIANLLEVSKQRNTQNKSKK
jgi:hypothetical protein